MATTEAYIGIARDAMASIDGQMTRRQELAVRYHCYGIVGMFGECLKDDGTVTASELSELIFERTPDFLKHAFGRAVGV